MVEDYTYVGVDFRGSAYLVLLEGAQWDASGEFQNVTLQKVIFDFLWYMYFFVVQWGILNIFVFHHLDRGMERPTWMPPFGWCGGVQVVTKVGGRSRGLREVERNLRGLTMGVPSMRLWDVPYHLQRHTVGVPKILKHMLQWVARGVMCYHEHNEIQENESSFLS